MTNYYRQLIFIITLLIVPYHTHCVDLVTQSENKSTIEEKMPDADNLGILWWDYFDVPKDILNNRISIFSEILKNIPPTLSPDKQKIANVFVEKITTNLQTYAQNLDLTYATSSQANPILSAYSIDEVVNLNQQLRNLKSELAITQREFSEKSKQKNTTQDLLETTKQQYNRLEKRSEDRILQGLKLISIYTSLEVLLQNIDYLKSAAKEKNKIILQLEEELEKAVHRVESSEVDVYLYVKKVKEKEDQWELTKQTLITLENEESSALSQVSNIENDDFYIKITQEVDQGEIKEVLAHNQYILATLKFNLAHVINEPKEVNLRSLKNKLQDYKTLTDFFKSRESEWSAQAERQLQRTGQILAENGKVQGDKKIELTEQQRDILNIAQGNLVLIQQLNNEINDTVFIFLILERKISEQIGGTKRWLQIALDYNSKAYSQSSYWLNKELYFVGKNPVTLFNILQFLLIILATIWGSKVILKMLTKFARQRKGIDKSLVYRVTRLFNYLFLGIGLVIALTAVGFDLSNFLLVAGALGVGLGFGLQSIFNNFISGIIILFESHLKVGDYVELESGLKGEIREINVRSTVITDNDGIDVLVPNSEIISKKVLNWTLKVPYRRVHVPFTIEYNTDKDLVAKLVVEAAKKIPHTLTRLGIPEPDVRLIRLGDNGMEFELIVWVTEKYTKRTRTTRSDYLWLIETTLRENNIVIPYPKREVYFPNQESLSNK